MMTDVHIQDSTCWCCGGKKATTTHHGIPQRLRPKRNVTIPTCEDCHKKINSKDITGLYSHLYRLEQLAVEIRNGADKVKKTLGDYIEDERRQGNQTKEEVEGKEGHVRELQKSVEQEPKKTDNS